MLFNKNDTLIIAGDSVTDCGRTYDADLAGWGSFGDGYVGLINAFMTGLYPELSVRVINKGVNGNTVVDLKKRWQQDVLDLKPDVVSIMIGVNDVWRHFDGTFKREELVTPEIYRHTYEEIIEATLPSVRNLLIMGSFMVEPNTSDPMGKMVREYAAIAKELAIKYNLIYIDTQKRIDDFTTHLSSYIISQDRVHPYGVQGPLPGHMILAKSFLDAAGFEWNK